MRILTTLALCLALLPVAVHARSKAEEIDNPTIALTTKAKESQVKKGVKMAVLNRKWTIANEKGNEFDASYTKPERRGDMTARIHVKYSTKEVKISYAGSENMGAEGSMIHPWYNRWIGNLVKDIPIYIEREVVASE